MERILTVYKRLTSKKIKPVCRQIKAKFHIRNGFGEQRLTQVVTEHAEPGMQTGRFFHFKQYFYHALSDKAD